MQRESICGVLSHNWDISVTLPPPHCSKNVDKGQKDCKIQSSGKAGRKQCLLDRKWQLRSFIWYVVVFACMHHIVAHIRLHTHIKHSGRDWGRAYETPFFAEELLEVNSFWGRENQSSLGVLSLVGCPFASGWLYIHVHMGQQ